MSNSFSDRTPVYGVIKLDGDDDVDFYIIDRFSLGSCARIKVSGKDEKEIHRKAYKFLRDLRVKARFDLSKQDEVEDSLRRVLRAIDDGTRKVSEGGNRNISFEIFRLEFDLEI